VFLPVLSAQILHDSLEYADVVVYRKQDRFCHVPNTLHFLRDTEHLFDETGGRRGSGTVRVAYWH
jgi:hypothetical protein